MHAPLATRLLAACAIALFSTAAFAIGQQQTTEGPRTVEQTVEATATVTAIDPATRAITLKSEDGEVRSIVAGPEVKRFDEIAVGDTVRARYSIGITTELRAPTEEERADPFVAIEGGGAAPAGQAPAAGVARMFRIVATIEALDRTTQTVTLKGPNGNYFTVRVMEPDMLVKPHIGDSVVVSAAESIAISLEKLPRKN